MIMKRGEGAWGEEDDDIIVRAVTSLKTKAPHCLAELDYPQVMCTVLYCTVL